MNIVWKLAVKDLRLLLRDRAGAFFILVFPILMGLFFGLVMNPAPGGGGGRGKMKIAVVDEDQTDVSRRFIESLSANENLLVEAADEDAARDSVRRGERTGLLIVPAGFAETAGILWKPAPTLTLGTDPSRAAESSMFQGMIMQSMGELLAQRFQDSGTMRLLIRESREQITASEDVDLVSRQLLSAAFGSLESMFDRLDELNVRQQNVDGEDVGLTAGGMQLAEFETLDVSREPDPDSTRGQLQNIRSRWDISFAQAMMWGVLGCVAGFSLSVVRERTSGTLFRLQVAPVSRFRILAAKALACFVAVLGVISLLTVLGVALGMQPRRYDGLVLAAVCVAACFSGLMMTLSVLGKTEQSVSGIGWAVNMVMAMFGGCMIPVMFMPEFIQKVSVLSPVKWAILAIEGAVWRNFTITEMVIPCAILLAVGGVGLTTGTILLNRMLQRA